jgi:hypothetical protein
LLDPTHVPFQYLGAPGGRLGWSQDKVVHWLWTRGASENAGTFKLLSDDEGPDMFLTSAGLSDTPENLSVLPAEEGLSEIQTTDGKVLQTNFEFGVKEPLRLIFGTGEGCDSCPEVQVARNVRRRNCAIL